MLGDGNVLGTCVNTTGDGDGDVGTGIVLVTLGGTAVAEIMTAVVPETITTLVSELGTSVAGIKTGLGGNTVGLGT